MNIYNQERENQKSITADTDNASNPSPHNTKFEPVRNDQLLSTEAEKYLREAANIEDEPDAQDQKEADDLIEKESGHQ